MGNNIISSLGAGSGIDVNSLVDGLVAVEKAPQENRLNTRQEKLEAQISAYGVMKSSLSEFQAVLAPLSNADTFNARAVSFPDTDVLTPNSLDADAQVGTYQIEVLEVAQSQSLASGAIADSKAALGEGEITIRFGEWNSWTKDDGPEGFTQNADKEALTISLDADDSLEDLVQKINDADVDLQASIIQTDGQSQLLLTTPSGADNAIEITTNDAALKQFSFKETGDPADPTDFSMLQTQAAQDATLKVNGLEVNRESNEIDDVIQGLSFNLNKVSAEKVTFSISEDTATGEQAIRDFVEAYNTLYETMKNLTGASTDEESEEVSVGSLATDGSAKSMLSQIRQMMTAAVPGVDNGFNALAYIGIRTELDGTLEIIEDDFSNAIKNSFDQISALFSPKSSASNTNVSVGYGTSIDQADAGTYTVDVVTEPAKGSLNADAVDIPAITSISAGFPWNTGTGDAYSFTINVDGIESGNIQLPNSTDYADESALATALQGLINGDSTLSAAGVAVNVGYNGGTGELEFNSQDPEGAVRFSVASADIGSSLGINATFPLDTGTGGTYSFTVNIDGTESNSIVLPDNKSYADADALATELQSLINGDSLLKAVGAAVDVSYNSADGRFEFNSRQYGASSSVNFSAASTGMDTLGINDALVGTAGQDAKGFIYNADTTKLTQGTLSGSNSVSLSGFNTGADDYSFTFSVDGVESNSITLPSNKTYADGDALAAELQSLINSDSLLKAAGAAVDVNYNGGRFEFSSRMFGSTSAVGVSAASTKMVENLGINDALIGTAGKGSTEGKVAFGAGNVLLPAVGSDAYGLTLMVESGSLGSSSFSYSRGLAGEMSLLIDSLLSGSGSITSREDNINDQLKGIETDREALDSRMSKVEARLMSQFLAMERILASLKTTGNSLDGILDRLPFTAKQS